MHKFLMASLLLFTTTTATMAWDVKKMDTQINNDLYVLQIPPSLGKPIGAICSAFDSPKQDYVITAAHCVNDFAKEKDFVFSFTQEWETAKGDEYSVTRKAKLLKVNKEQDWAVLKMEPSPIKHKNNVKINLETPTRGEEIYAAGAPFGIINTLTKGIISNPFVRFAQYQNMVLYQIDAIVGPGNSGGPLYNDKGEIIGIISSTFASQQVQPIGSWSWVVPIRYVDKEYLK